MVEGCGKGISGTDLWKHLAYLVGGEDHCGGILMSLVGSYKEAKHER